MREQSTSSHESVVYQALEPVKPKSDSVVTLQQFSGNSIEDSDKEDEPDILPTRRRDEPTFRQPLSLDAEDADEDDNDNNAAANASSNS
ncbi:hypothetical protein ElyMa_006625700 [Elysia marginata]|uniref:Uncharacterized protein n=1 Tax=Elysia marginata TaxID=1093978 RepID=A0AAV4IHJ7_9GAST|nr:hypothetical protein ElyMa_006625700 [Elysia marginata]